MANANLDRDQLEQLVARYAEEIDRLNHQLTQETAARIKAQDASCELEETFEQRVRQRTAEFNQLFEAAPIGLCFLDTELRYVHINQTLARINGRSVEAHLGRRVREVLPDLAEQLEPLYHHILKTGEPNLNIEVRGTTPATPDVVQVWLVSYYPVMSPEGKVQGIGAIVQDITHRKQIDGALRLQKEFVELIIQTSPNLIFVKDKDGVFLLVNQAMADSFGMSREAMVQKHNAEVHQHPDEVEAYVKADQAVILHGETLTVEEPFSTPEGEVRWYQTIKTPLVQPDGTVHVLGISTDITELKRAQKAADQKQELARLVAELEAKNEELERFTYTVSHDLKSPLVTVKGFLGLLQKDVAQGNTKRIQGDIEQIQAAADKMGALLSDLLELSRIGRLVNPSVEVSLIDLIHEALGLVAGQINERGVEVVVEPDLPMVFGDHLRLLEVLQNLIDNAVKFMGGQPMPRIEIGVQDEGEAVFFVRDNGIGIKPAYHQKIFGLFERLDGKTTGTGIGLALVKRIIEVHDGRLWVESRGPGQGSTFKFTLPGEAS